MERLVRDKPTSNIGYARPSLLNYFDYRNSRYYDMLVQLSI